MNNIIFTMLLLLGSFSAFAQKSKSTSLITRPTEFPTKAGRIYYEGVVELGPNAKQARLYRAGRTWFVDTYEDAKSVLQMDDKEDGRMVGKGFYNYGFSNGLNISEVTMRFTLALDVRDGKYRYRIYDFVGENINTGLLKTNSNGNTTELRVIDYNKAYADYKANKRTKYNLKILQGMDLEVRLIVGSLRRAMVAAKAGRDDF